MRLVFSERAERHLEEIALWIAHDNPRGAESYTGELRAVCARILNYPLAFPELRGRRGRKLHKRTYGAYLIIYEVKTHHCDSARRSRPFAPTLTRGTTLLPVD